MIQNLDELKPYLKLSYVSTKSLAEAGKWAIATSVFHARHLYKKIVNNPNLPTVGFYPQKPWSYYDIWKVCKILGVDFKNKPEEADIIFTFQDQTEANYVELHKNQNQRVIFINKNCTNVTKTHVQEVFKDVFGYELGLDPKTYQGEMVVKSDLNAAHDGQIVQGPVVEIKKGYAYQRLIHNEVHDGLVVDHRTCVVGNRVALVYNKYRPQATRFGNSNTGVEIKEVNEIFSAPEQAQIVEFAKKIGLDYGGVDVLRHKDDGRIYIVDANKTPWGPPSLLSLKQKVEAMETLAEAFLEEFLLPTKQALKAA